jgi:hypothetical protein
MSLKLHFASLSLGAAVDQQTGNMSVFELVEEIRTPQVPINLQSLVIALSLLNTSGQDFRGKIFIHILTPDGKQGMVGNGEIHCPPEQRRMRAVFRFGGFPVAQYGAHRFVVSWMDQNNQKVGEALLDFDVTQAAQVAQGAQPTEKPRLSH